MLCLWPFKHLSIDPRGNFRPCCSWRHIDFKSYYPESPQINFNDSSIDDYFKSLYLKTISSCMEDDQFPKGGCMDCEKDISIGNQDLSLLNDGFLKYTNNNEFKLHDMEIKFGNLCNLGCVMCSPANSSLLENESLSNQDLFDEYGIPGHTKKILRPGIQWYEREDKLEELSDYAAKCKHIRFTGGEPTINGYLQNFLTHLAKRNTDITLKITTNGHKVSDKLLESLSKFHHVHFDFSVDGYGKVNEFIRWPSSFENINTNMEKCARLNNTFISVKTTLQALNVHNIADICEWVEHNDYINSWDINLVWDPEFLQPCLASESSKQLYRDFALNNTHIKCENVKYGLNALNNKFDEEQTQTHKKTIDKYLMLLSEMRKLDWKEYIKL